MDKIKYPEVRNFIGGQFTANGQARMDVLSPIDGTVISKVLLSKKSDLMQQ